MKGRIVICDYCGTPADFVDSSVVYHGHSFGMIYLCPRCGAYVGVHKGSDKPLGRLANSELRNWKKAAHAAFDPLWKYGPYRGRRNEAYRWLSEKMGTPIEFTHIGMFDVDQCRKVVRIMREERNQLWEDLNVQTIAIPVEEYKELIQKQAELSLIYHKGAGGSVYDIGNFVLDLMLAVHPELITKQEDTDAE